MSFDNSTLVAIALIAFIMMDITASIKTKNHIARKGVSWLGAFTCYSYHAANGGLYLHMAVKYKFLIIIDITELHAWLWPASSIFCFFMFFFHSWAFAASIRSAP